MNITHTAFFGDGQHSFTLTDDVLTELERITGAGIGALYIRLGGSQFRAADLFEVIRLGLIGAGTTPEAAMQLCQTYVRNRPLAEVLPLALDVLDARWTGTARDETPEDVAHNAAADFAAFAASEAA